MKITIIATRILIELRKKVAVITKSKKILSKLAKDEYWFIRYAVAGNPSTSKETLSELAKDEDFDVRKAVAKNPNFK